MCVHACVRARVCVRVCVHVCARMCACVCVHVHMHVCMRMCVHMCVCACVCARMRLREIYILLFLLVNNLLQGDMTGVKCMANKIPFTIFTHTRTQMNINALFMVLRSNLERSVYCSFSLILSFKTEFSIITHRSICIWHTVRLYVECVIWLVDVTSVSGTLCAR